MNMNIVKVVRVLHWLRDLMQDGLHDPIFNPTDVDNNMHDKLVRAFMDDMDVNNMEDVSFFKRKVETVLRELLAD
jgi:hypothetical protein